MSGEDDTFDIDLYGNEDDQQDLYGQEEGQNDGEHDGTRIKNEPEQPGAGDEEIDFDEPPVKQEPRTIEVKTEPTPEVQKQGTKRKASFDEEEQQPQRLHSSARPSSRSIDPNATPALKLAELHWWTTEEDLRGFCAKAGTEAELQDLSFGEHKVNGKAKGEAYMEFASPAAASKTKAEIERQTKGEGEGMKKIPYQVSFTYASNPFRNAKDAGGAVGAARKDFGAPQAGGRGGSGAYNNFNNNRGNFGGRGGGFNQNRGGGGGYGGNNNNFQNRMGGGQQQQQQGNWGMNGNFGGGGGGGGQGYGGMGGMAGMGGMQGMFNNPAMMMQNMQGMMQRGGFGGGMGGMGGMGMRGGGGNMMGRGGWGGGGGIGGVNFGGQMGNGYGGGGGGGGGYGQGQGQQNKRPKME